MGIRLDVELVKRGLFESREKARFAIEKQSVSVNGKTVTKASFQVDADIDEISVTANVLPYVSVGGFKLEKAIRDFSLDFQGKTVLDVGASTGGFTDCALQAGALMVFAIDVGSGQLHPTLKGRSEVISLENMNVRDLNTGHLENRQADIVVMDVSFTSQIPLFPYLKKFLTNDGFLLTLIKPQFEMETHKRFKGGIVRDEKEHSAVLKRIEAAAKENGFVVLGIIAAPEEEGKNKEYLALFKPVDWKV